MNTINLQAKIDAVIELKGTINVSANKGGGAETGGMMVVNLFGGKCEESGILSGVETAAISESEE